VTGPLRREEGVHLRPDACLLVLVSAAAAWYAMMIVHESGHAIAAWVSGGRVVRVVLHPLAFSRTDVSPNPHPLLVVWSGPVWGAAVPLGLWMTARARKMRLAFLLRFFAGFCLIANGVYLASAAVVPAGDTEDLLRLGTPLWAVAAAGIAAFAGGLTAWNRLGPRFGFNGQSVDRATVTAAAVSLGLLIAGMLAWSSIG
jgi:hypothetical protein